jgi:hypothetical protein
MRDYGTIQSAYWTHPDIKGVSDGAKLLGAYLLTCPHANGLGCFHAPVGYIATDLGWTHKTVCERLDELFRNGFCKRCERTEYVLIPNFLRWNPIANANVAKARVVEYKSIPSGFMYFNDLGESMRRYGAFWPNGFETVTQTVTQTVSKPDPTLPYPNHISAPEPEPEKPTVKAKRFTPPSVVEVAAHVKEKGYTFSAEKFVAYYESKGWVVGTSPMKSWKAACATWQSNQDQQAPQQQARKRSSFDELLARGAA